MATYKLMYVPYYVTPKNIIPKEWTIETTAGSFTKCKVHSPVNIGRAINTPIRIRSFFCLNANTPENRINEKMMSIRMRIPIRSWIKGRTRSISIMATIRKRKRPTRNRVKGM